jgi:hypothetical protein
MRTLSLSRQEPKENLNEAALKRATLLLLANEKDERQMCGEVAPACFFVLKETARCWWINASQRDVERIINTE